MKLSLKIPRYQLTDYSKELLRIFGIGQLTDYSKELLRIFGIGLVTVGILGGIIYWMQESFFLLLALLMAGTCGILVIFVIGTVVNELMNL